MKKSLWIMLILMAALLLPACSGGENAEPEGETSPEEKAYSRYLSFMDDEPTTFDPQCTTEYYTVPLNIFDRLVEVETVNGESNLVPSLATSWEVSEDGLTYTFQLRPDVTFSNGSKLTPADVQFTFERLITHPNSENGDLVMMIEGAQELLDGDAERLSGFKILDDHSFTITLSYPYAAFLACLSTPGASILDAESTKGDGRDFGLTIRDTIGCGPFILEAWEEGVEIRMKANPDYWGGAPECDGLRMLFLVDTVSQRALYDEGELDILDMENMGIEAEYFIHGDIYRTNLARGPRVGITYLALNESIAPLDNVQVRKALQLGLDRELLVNAVVSGRGTVENGIFPQGLHGHNRELPEIPYDPETAQALLAGAGYANGIDLELYCTTNASVSEMDQLEIIASMWEKIGVRARIVALDSDEFMSRRKQGALTCYVSTWSADFNDPDNFIYTFFGTKENTTGRSLCYANDAVIERIVKARSIADDKMRIREYQDLERQIIQEEAAWIPLYSKLHLFVVSDRVEGFQVAWNGWSSNRYYGVKIRD